MGTRFLAETRFRGMDTVASQLVHAKLQGLGYRHRPQLRLLSQDVDNRFQRYERRAHEDDSLVGEIDRLKAVGLWSGLRSLRFL